MALSPDGKHVAAACFDGVICIFNWKTKQLVEKYKHKYFLLITDLLQNLIISYATKTASNILLFSRTKSSNIYRVIK